jgi:hypothetical protein
MKARTVRLAVLSILAGVAALASAWALAALNAGGEAAPIRIAAGYDRQAEPLLRGAALMRPANRARATELSRRAIAQFPYDTSAWLRLAYVDSLDHGGLTPAGVAYLKRSYDLVAIDPFVGLWRIRFALENSQSLSPGLRASVRDEASGLWRNGENREPLHEMARSIGNPAGRLSLSLWLSRLEMQATK